MIAVCFSEEQHINRTIKPSGFCLDHINIAQVFEVFIGIVVLIHKLFYFLSYSPLDLGVLCDLINHHLKKVGDSFGACEIESIEFWQNLFLLQMIFSILHIDQHCFDDIFWNSLISRFQIFFSLLDPLMHKFFPPFSVCQQVPIHFPVGGKETNLQDPDPKNLMKSLKGLHQHIISEFKQKLMNRYAMYGIFSCSSSQEDFQNYIRSHPRGQIYDRILYFSLLKIYVKFSLYFLNGVVTDVGHKRSERFDVLEVENSCQDFSFSFPNFSLAQAYTFSHQAFQRRTEVRLLHVYILLRIILFDEFRVNQRNHRLVKEICDGYIIVRVLTLDKLEGILCLGVIDKSLKSGSMHTLIRQSKYPIALTLELCHQVGESGFRLDNTFVNKQ